MAEAAAQLDDDLLPPEVLVDDLPVTEEELDEFAELVAKVADSVGCTQEEALDLLWEPPAEREGFYDEDGQPVAELPPVMRAAGELDEDKADWAMAHYAQAEAAIKAAKEKYKLLVERLERWKAKELRRPETDLAFFGMILEAYGRAQRAATGTATFTMPSGAIKTRTKNKGGGLAITEPTAVTEWLKTSVGVEFLSARIGDALDNIEQGLDGGAGPDLSVYSDEIEAVLTRLVDEVLTADPYEGALNAKDEPLVSKLGQHVRIEGNEALDLVSGDPVPGVKVEPESVGVTISPN